MSRTGIIYLMTCAQPYIVKIGRTEDETSFRNRMNRIEKDGYENFNGWKRKFAIRVDDYEEKEALLHNVFAARRIGKSEAFVLDWEIVQQLMSALEGELVYPKGESKDAAFDEAVAEYEDKQLAEVTDASVPRTSKTRTLDNVPSDVTFHYQQSRGKWHARMRVIDGNCVVLKGSTLGELKSSANTYVRDLREQHAGVVSQQGNCLVLSDDVPFSKPSRASSFCLRRELQRVGRLEGQERQDAQRVRPR